MMHFLIFFRKKVAAKITSYLLTESGTVLVTEAGDRITT